MALRSNLTDQWEGLYFLYLGIALVIGAAVLGWLFYSMWRFRWRPDAPRPPDAPQPGVLPAERGHVLWVYVMAGAIAAIMFSLAFSTISAIDVIENPPEGEPAIHHNVTGFQFGWKFNYTGAGGIPFQQVSPSGAFVVPVDTNVVMNVTSQDVWHNFAIPDYRIRIDAIPGELNHLWFRAETLGVGHTVCVQICGSGHAFMRAEMKVVTKKEYAQWIEDRSNEEYAKLVKKNTTTIVDLAYDTFDSASAMDGGKLPAGRAIIFNATAVGGAIGSGSAEFVVSQGETVLARTFVPEGGRGYLYVDPTVRGPLQVRANGYSWNFEVS
jgi:cytochrome c oxidase subunit II